jgi:acyl-CoA synthetase (AMP-forming)/AMP-acid ligase II
MKNIELSLFENLLSGFKDPNNVKLIYGGRKFNERTVLSEIYRVRKFLKANNYQEGDVTTIALPNIPAMVFAIYGVSASGGISNLLSPVIGKENLRENLVRTKTKFLFVLDYYYNLQKEAFADLDVKVVVCRLKDFSKPAYRPFIKGYKTDLTNVTLYTDLSPASDDDTDYVKMSPAAPALYLNSGGTSGVPKTVVHSSRGLNALTDRAAYRVFEQDKSKLGGPYTKDDVMMGILPFFHAFGFAMCVHVSMPRFRLLIMPMAFSKLLPFALRRNKITLFAAVPVIFKRVMELPIAHFSLKTVKCSFVGGDKVTKKLLDEYTRITKGKSAMIEGFGLTETASVFALCYRDEPQSEGKPLDGTTIIVIDHETLEKLPIGEKGEILVNTPSMMLEYLDEGETSSAFLEVDGTMFLRTGDYGYIDETGAMHFIERLKRSIKISAVNIFPQEIEEIIIQNPAIKECCVARKSNAQDKGYTKAYVVMEDKDEPLSAQTIDEVSSLIRLKLNKYCVPREFQKIDAIAKTQIGKNDFKYYEALED